MLAGFAGMNAAGQGSFATLQPSFTETGHVPPETTTPPPRDIYFEYIDVGVLFVALCAAAFFALKTRSRRGMVILTVFSLLYFGFWRRGCVCPVGSVQNVALALADSSYAIPLIVVAFFALPLIFALLFGRVFCAGVCPLGAIQELVVVKPVNLPIWLNKALSIFPYVFLGLAITFTVCNAGFIICRYDPFVGFFRMGASYPMLLFGGALLVIGMFVGRPYCRFLCPYGVLLGWCSGLSKKHVTITPDKCIQCRLCETSCPYDTILMPLPESAPDPLPKGTRRLAVMLLLAPVLVIGGAWIGSRMAVPLSFGHPQVRLAEQVLAEDRGMTAVTTIDSDTFRLSGMTHSELYAQTIEIRRQFGFAGWFLGGFIGLVIVIKLLTLSIRRKQPDYIPDNVNCYSCTRCFKACPVEEENEERRASAEFTRRTR